MEDKDQEIPNEAEILHQEGYHPRPAWQVWAARIGAGIVLIAFLLYCWQIAQGGL